MISTVQWLPRVARETAIRELHANNARLIERADVALCNGLYTLTLRYRRRPFTADNGPDRYVWRENQWTR